MQLSQSEAVCSCNCAEAFCAVCCVAAVGHQQQCTGNNFQVLLSTSTSERHQTLFHPVMNVDICITLVSALCCRRCKTQMHTLVLLQQGLVLLFGRTAMYSRH